MLTGGEIVRAIAVVGNVSSYSGVGEFLCLAEARGTSLHAARRDLCDRQQIKAAAPPVRSSITRSTEAMRRLTQREYTAPLVLTTGQIVRGIAVVGNTSSYQASASFAVTSDSSSSSIPASPFGLTVLDFTKLSPSMSFGTTRSWDAWPNLDWSDANPSPGTYKFADLDKFIAVNQACGVEIIYVLGRTPTWASSQPNAPAPYGPGQCSARRYERLRKTISPPLLPMQLAGIKYWELWNELR